MVKKHIEEAFNLGRNGPRQGRELAADMQEQGIKFVDKGGRRWTEKAYATMVATTELADAANIASIGVAEQIAAPGVRVADGGPGDVDEPCRIANGQAWQLLYANLHRYEHPNCRRAFAPLASTFKGRFDRTNPSPRTLLDRLLAPFRKGYERLAEPVAPMSLAGVNSPGDERVFQTEGEEHARTEQTLQQLREIEDYLHEQFPALRSTWNGKLIVDPEDAGYYGVKTWDCSIRLSTSTLSSLVNAPNTALHEMFHALSPGFENHPRDYAEMPGFEEGVVEMSTRLHRAGALGLDIDEIARDSRDPTNAYNGYIDVLEGFRERLGVEPRGFYDKLMSVPLAERPAVVHRMGVQKFKGTDGDEWDRYFGEEKLKLFKKVQVRG